MKNKMCCLTGLFLMLLIPVARAQFEFSGEIRPRSEFRNGFFTLPGTNSQPAFFTSQRTRVDLSYTQKNRFSTFISLQDVRVWGDQDQLADEPSLGVFQAWAKIKIASHLHVKAGRQELFYDDGYILGTLNWRQTGRSHDAAVFQWKDSTFQAHLGLAYNQSGARNYGTFYQGDYYKALQILWLKKEWQSLSLSFLGVNRGMQMGDTTLHFTQTLGPTLQYRKGRYTLKGIFYYQTGKDLTDKQVQAYFWSASLGFVTSPRWSWWVGTDVLSGTSLQDFSNPSYTKNHTFDILYGFRHRHFGHMDYFYLNFTPPAGLQDWMVKTKYQPRKNLQLNADLHSFSSQASLLDADRPDAKINRHLGVETDFYFSYTPYQAVTYTGGYSQMFASPSMELVKGSGNRKALACWVWVSVTLKPTFYASDTDSEP